MPAYVIVDIGIIDPEAYAEYIKLVPPTIAKYGGRYIVRGGKAEKLEGDWNPRRVVVVEFESADRAKEWSDSKEYEGPKRLRQQCATANIIVVEGL